MPIYIRNTILLKHHIKGAWKVISFFDEEKQKLIKIKEELNIVELKKSVEMSIE